MATVTINEETNTVTVNEDAETVTVVSGTFTVSSGGGGGATNLAYTSSASNGIVTSDTGTDATLPLATASIAGLLTPAQFSKLALLSGTNTGDQNLSSYATTAAVAAGYQPLDSDLTSIAALTTATFGRSALTWADAAAGRTALSLGTLATLSTVTLTSNVTGTLPIANGGTGITALGTALQVLRTNAGATALEFATLAGGGDAQTADPLSQFAATTSAQLRGVISDESGTGALLFDGATLNVDSHVADFTTLILDSGGALFGSAGSTIETAGQVSFQTTATFTYGGAAAATHRTALGLVIGTNVQAYDADLVTWSGVTPGTGVTGALAAGINTTGGVLTTEGTATLTNKTISGASNTLTSIPAAELTGNVAVARIATALTTPGAIGGTTPSTGAFTTISASGAATITGLLTATAAGIAGERLIAHAMWDGAGSALSAATAKGVWVAPQACTITGYNISADAGTCTVKTWKKVTGTAIPTVVDLISTSGVGLSTGTNVRSTTTSDFTTTAVAKGDILRFDLTAVATATWVKFELEMISTS